ncbi:hypothetical protein HY409_03440 [Candidatus Gottesmanbacteria bacterium]|nr:hypothetical protein [Candidatus Gottesmanbacteria bacterium]
MPDVIPEAVVDHVNHFDSQLRNIYGADFLQSYYASQNMRFEDTSYKSPDIPFFKEAKPILQNSSNFHFVEWQQDNGAIDWRYIVSSQEKIPGDDGTYTCQRSFRYDEGNKQWIQEVTQIETTKPLPMHDKVSRAVKPSLNSALSERLGAHFLSEFTRSDIIDVATIEQHSMGREVKTLLPKGDVRVRYLNKPGVQSSALINVSRKNALTDTYGSNFEQAYEHAPTFIANNLTAENIHQLPQVKKFLKEHGGSKAKFEFKYVTWTDDTGANQTAYVIKWYSSREGQKRKFFEIAKLNSDKDGKPEFHITYYPFTTSPLEEFLQPREEPCWIIEQVCGDQHLVQVLEPSLDEKGAFRNIFIGIEDMTTKKCLVFNDIFPEATYITKQLDKKRVLSHVSILIDPNPIISLPILDLSTESHYVLKQVLTLRASPTMAIAHELGHYALRAIYRKINTGDEVAADSNVLLTIQVAREQGVNLYNGVPDNQIILLNIGG